MTKFFDEIVSLIGAIIFTYVTIYLYLEEFELDVVMLSGFMMVFFIALFLAIMSKHLGE